jgi:hemolysin III
MRVAMATLHPDAFRLLVAGGVAYTAGVPSFLRNREFDHAIWHLFVLAGSACHFVAILKMLPAALHDSL